MLHHYPICLIKRVIDGDTCEGIVDMGMDTFKKCRLRLYGVNCPELHGPDHETAIAAKTFLTHSILDKQVSLDWHGTDSFGRELVVISVGDVDVNTALLDAGLAVRFIKDDHGPELGDDGTTNLRVA